MISDVLKYARTRLAALGYVEHQDGFNYENVPRTNLDSRFHVVLGQVNGTKVNQDNQEIEANFMVRVFKSPGRNTPAIVDSSVVVADTIIMDFLKASNRLGQSGLKNIGFNTMTIEPLNDSNDNGVIISISFTALVVFSTR